MLDSDGFIDDMDSAYAWADLVICRSGALTVSELMAVGVASILVPFPFAVDDHQYLNARILQDHQAAEVVRESDLTVSRLQRLISGYSMYQGCIEGSSLCFKQAVAAYQLAERYSVQLIIDVLRAVALSRRERAHAK